MQSEKPVVERLMLYKKIYNDKRTQAMKSSPDYSFSPQINSYTQNTSRSDLYSPKAKTIVTSSYSFKPTLNANSLKIAEKLGTFGNRTLSHNKSSSVERYSFKPEINKTASISSLKSSSPR